MPFESFVERKLLDAKASGAHNVWCVEKTPDPCAAVIFGASGDLTERKLVPALYSLFRQRLLPKSFFVLGFGRTPMTDADFRKKMSGALQSIPDGQSSLQEFIQRFHYVAGDYADPNSYKSLGETLQKLDTTYQTQGNRVFYLSTPPTLYTSILGRIGASGLAAERNSSKSWSRIIIEKPFGEDLDSAIKLSQGITQYFREHQIYRMDHYLGKETVQNIMVFRFANILFEPVWNRSYIDHVQITAAEDIGVGHRAGYYDQAGCLRDMFQNHMLQLLCLTAMEPPASFDADQVRDEKAKVLRSFRPIPLEKIDALFIRGQYTGYLKEQGVKPNSNTETFVASKLFIDNWRWQGVPFYLRSGKRLNRRVTQISVQFRQVPHPMFANMAPEEICPNVLLMRIQPDEGIMLSFEAKSPGPKISLATVPMNFSYSESFKTPAPEAYERLFLDCMLGDQTLFAREDWLELSWSYLTPILEHWKKTSQRPYPYAQGTWGPAEANRLIESDGRLWND